MCAITWTLEVALFLQTPSSIFGFCHPVYLRCHIQDSSKCCYPHVGQKVSGILKKSYSHLHRHILQAHSGFFFFVIVIQSSDTGSTGHAFVN